MYWVEYERNEVLPSVEISRKVADILDGSLDYLTRKVDVQMDKSIRNRILGVTKFNDDYKTISSLLLMTLLLEKYSLLYKKKTSGNRGFLFMLFTLFHKLNLELFYNPQYQTKHLSSYYQY